ncbi:MAG: type II toxin-antitoxin system VapC family toxin [Chloroflexia bacterium]
MKLLLDTHIFLWFISGDKQLSLSLRENITDPENEVYLSVISIWEAIIKNQHGKLPLPQPPETYLPLQREHHQIATLPIDEASVRRLSSLPPLHRDPFDRMIICQALEHKMSIVTEDYAVRSYSVPVLG